MKERVSGQELIDATRQLAMLARLRFPLAEGLKDMGERSRWLGEVAENMERGDGLAQAAERHPQVFSPFYVSMVSAAEASERPENTLTTLSEWLERADTLRSGVRTALFYPFMMLNVMLVQAILFCGFVFPQVVRPLANTEGSGVLSFFSANALGLEMGLVVLAVVLNWAYLSDRLSAWIPALGQLSEQAEQALWARAAASLLAAGVELPRALEKAASVVGKPRLRAALNQLAEAVRRGDSLSAALAKLPSLDGILLYGVRAGEDREELASSLLDSADYLDQMVAAQSEQYIRMVGPSALIALGVMVSISLLSFWDPFYTLTGGIQ